MATRLWSRRSLMATAVAAVTAAAAGCMRDPKPAPYGRENALILPSKKRQIWAVAPAINLSGQRDVDPLLQADLAFEQLQQIGGLTVLPVNRVAQVYVAMNIENAQSPEQAAKVCEALGADGLIVPTVTIFDPYNPPKFGGALQLFRRVPAVAVQQAGVDEKEGTVRLAGGEIIAPGLELVQSVGMYDAANGSVRDALQNYARGRHDPAGPMGAKEYLISMDRYCGFAYRSLAEGLLYEMRKSR